MNNDEFSGNIFQWDIYTILNYIKVNYIQFSLLVLVFIIIYVVDCITNFNASIFTFPSAIPGIASNSIKNKKVKKIKR